MHTVLIQAWFLCFCLSEVVGKEGAPPSSWKKDLRSQVEMLWARAYPRVYSLSGQVVQLWQAPLPSPTPPPPKILCQTRLCFLEKTNAELLRWADGSFLPRCVLGFLRFNQILVFVTRHGHTSVSHPYCPGPWEYQFRSSAQYTEKDAIKGINIVFPFCCGLLTCYSSVFCLFFSCLWVSILPPSLPHPLASPSLSSFLLFFLPALLIPLLPWLTNVILNK